MPETAASPLSKLPRWAPFVLVFAAFCAALAGWYFFALHDDDVALYRGLGASDAAAVGAALDRENIAYHFDAAGDVLVASSHEAEARRRLAAAHAGPASVQGFELFDNSDMGLTDFAQKIKYQRALQGELERTLMMMDGIVSARVHISEPDRTLFETTPETAKAAVTLVTRTPAAEAPDRIAGIRRLVAAAVADLSVSDVVVLDANGDILSSDVELLTADPNAAAAAATPTQLYGPSDQSFIDLVTTVVGRAIPHTRFSIALDASAPLVASPAAGAAAPASANNQVNVTVTTNRTLTTEDLVRVREALTAAAQASGKPIGTIVFRADSETASTGARVPQAHAAPSGMGGSTMLAIIALLGVALLAFAALSLWLWRRSARPLSAEDHQTFAAELKKALASEERAHEAA